MSSYSPPPNGPAPYGQPGPAPYGPPAGHGDPAPHNPPPGAAFPYGQQPAYGPAGQPQWPAQRPGEPLFTPTGPPRRPWLRPVIALAVVAALGTGFWVLSVVTDDGKPPEKVARDARIGDCLENRGTHSKPVLFTIECKDAKADYQIVLRPGYRENCPDQYDQYEERGGRLGDTTLCLNPVRH